MEVIVFIIWVISLALFGIATFMPRPFNIMAGGLLAFDLWIGLQFLVEATDPITL